jgi:tetratricopeptide (TPR) repeat protein
MRRRGTLVFIVAAACLGGLGACSSTSKLGDGGGLSDTSNAANGPANGPPGILSGLWPSKSGDSQSNSQNNPSDQLPAGGDTTGTVSTNTQPAEPGPSGEPVAPLAAPGLSGDDPNDDLQKGKRYFRNNDFGLAEQSFRKAVEKYPRDAEAWVDLAASYDRLHRFDLADRAYAGAIRLIGPTPQILNDQGFSYMLRGDYARAHDKLSQAQAKDPANPYIRANLQLLERAYRDGKSVQ